MLGSIDCGGCDGGPAARTGPGAGDGGTLVPPHVEESLPTPRPVLLDLDGTLVDSLYQHVVTWARAFREHGHEVPLWRIHASIGMGSDRMVPWLLGGHVDHAESLSDDHVRRFLELADELRPTPGAVDLIEDLEVREVPFLIATSAGDAEKEALLAALGRADLETTHADEVASSKPAPDLLEASVEQLGAPASAVTLVGDSPWDARAGTRLGMRCIAVRCGGFGDAALTGAGAIDVVDAPRDLIGRL